MSLIIIAIGLPLSLLGFFLTRAYCRALDQKSKPTRYSHRAKLFNEVPTF